MVSFGSGQGRREVETGGVAALRRGFQPSDNAGLDRKAPFLDWHYIANWMTAPVTTILTNDAGISTFHPNAMSWS
jgi:hypothetical protein